MRGYFISTLLSVLFISSLGCNDYEPEFVKIKKQINVNAVAINKNSESITNLNARVLKNEADIAALQTASGQSPSPVAGQQTPRQIAGLNPHTPEPSVPPPPPGQQGLPRQFTIISQDGTQYQCTSYDAPTGRCDSSVSTAPPPPAFDPVSPGLASLLQERFGESEKREEEILAKQDETKELIIGGFKRIEGKLTELGQRVADLEKIRHPASMAPAPEPEMKADK